MAAGSSHKTLLGLFLVAATGLVVMLALLLREEDPPATAPPKRPVAARPRPPANSLSAWDEDATPTQVATPRPVATTVSDGGKAAAQELGNLEVGTILAVHKQVEVTQRLQQNAREAERVVDAFCEDARIHEAKHFFPEHERTHDAASFMADRVTWGEHGKPGSLELKGDLGKRVNSYRTDWATRITDEDLAGLDFSWMHQAGAFDHWSLLGAGPMRENAAEDQYPALLVFQAWTLAAAAADLRHLASVVESQDTIMARLIAGSMLVAEKRAYGEATARGLDVTGWTPPDFTDEDRARLKRVTLAGHLFFLPGVPPAVMQKAARCMGHRCDAVYEALRSNCSMASFSPDENRPDLDAVAAGAGCDGAMLERTRKCDSTKVDDAFDWSLDALTTFYPAAP